MAQPRAFGAHLPIEVRGNTTVDGNHVVNPGDGFRRVDVFQRRGRNAGVLIHPVVQGLRTEDDAKHPLVAVDGAAGAGEFTGAMQRIVRVAAQLCVHPQILQVGLGQQRANYVRHTPDAKLKRCPGGNLRYNQLRDF